MAVNQFLNQCINLELPLLIDNTKDQDFGSNKQELSHPEKNEVTHPNENSVENLQQGSGNPW